MNTQNNHYNKKLQPIANSLRKNMTKAEACLWKYVLQGQKLKGYQFRRQRPVLKYIADFMCKELNLVIEVDGISHHYDEILIKDRKKQSDLENAGFVVLRFSDEEVLTDINNVIRSLVGWIENYELKNPPLNLQLRRDRLSQEGRIHPRAPASGGQKSETT